MVQLENIVIDKKEVEEKLKGTQLKMNTIILKMQHAVNRKAIKRAKESFREKFNIKNHSYNLQEGQKYILSSFRSVKNKNVKGATQVKNNAFYAKFLEIGATIEAKQHKYLTFKVGGEWKKSESITLPARPFLKPALMEVWNSPEAKKIQEEVLQKELNKYWEKNGV